ncbi:MAG: V-type ATP synthase subunit F, partial [Desulfurococcales archaeon]|nr:V-type ATP synthase subunit F [Desulfurococcales archaeon]
MSSGLKVLVVGDRFHNPLFRSAGLETVEAEGLEDVAEKIRAADRSGEYAVIIVLKHLVGDEQELRRRIQDVATTVLVLPTRWSPGEPVNIDKLIASALGLG